jgi:putative hydrolase of the HAD superfamily
MATLEADAVLFDLGNTLVSYYKATEFYPILERSISAVTRLLQAQHRSAVVEHAFERAKAFDSERPDFRVWPLKERLNEIFAPRGETLPDELLRAMSQRFLEPIFATAKPNPEAVPVLSRIRALGLKRAIVSNTPWGSPAMAWREELHRWGLLELVDEAMFCVDVGWRKPAPQIFEHTLARLGVAPQRALFVGDDPRWDVEGARRSGIAPVLLSDVASTARQCHTIQRLADLIPMLQRSAHTH